MNNFFRYNGNSKFRLIGKINGLAEDVRKTRDRLAKRYKAEKPTTILLGRKRAVGDDIRHHLLAYAFLRETPYNQLERKCREDNKPDAQKILEIVQLHSTFNKSWNLSQVQTWLEGQ